VKIFEFIGWALLAVFIIVVIYACGHVTGYAQRQHEILKDAPESLKGVVEIEDLGELRDGFMLRTEEGTIRLVLSNPFDTSALRYSCEHQTRCIVTGYHGQRADLPFFYVLTISGPRPEPKPAVKWSELLVQNHCSP
jgi:hypothetical protein